MKRYNACCFIGHRTITVTEQLTAKLTKVMKDLIAQGTTIFNFGSHSQFDDWCYEMITAWRRQHPQIQRVHYCLPYENYRAAGFTDRYEQEIDCEDAFKATRNAYIMRNFAMIDASDLCIFYYDPTYTPRHRQSGTALAYHYARKRQKPIINLLVEIAGCDDERTT